MKRILAILVTLAGVFAIVKFAQPRPATDTRGQLAPVACIDRMFTAASRGDVASYVDCFSGAEREAIERSLNQASTDTAADSLRKTMADLRGWAVVDPPTDTKDSDQCSIVVERIYTGRVDRQKMDLQRISGLWKIRRVEPAQPIQPPVPYGTHVSGAPASGNDQIPMTNDQKEKPE